MRNAVIDLLDGGSWLKSNPLLLAELACVMVMGQLTKERTLSAGCTDMSG